MIDTGRRPFPLYAAVLWTLGLITAALVTLNVWFQASNWYRARFTRPATQARLEPTVAVERSPLEEAGSTRRADAAAQIEAPAPSQSADQPPPSSATSRESLAEPRQVEARRRPSARRGVNPPVSAVAPPARTDVVAQRQTPASAALAAAPPESSAEALKDEEQKRVRPATAKPGRLRLSSAYDVELLLNGSLAFSGTVADLALAPGRHQLTISNPTYLLRETRLIEVAEGATVEVSTPELVSCALGATPRDAEISIGDRVLGRGFVRFTAAEGTYLVDFRWVESGKVLRRAVALRKGMKPVYVNRDDQ